MAQAGYTLNREGRDLRRPLYSSLNEPSGAQIAAAARWDLELNDLKGP